MKKAICRILSVLLIAAFLPTLIFADEWFLEDGSITVTATESGQNVSQGGGDSREDAAPVIKNRDPSTSTSNTVTIEAKGNATTNVTIENTNISAPSGKAGIQAKGEGNVNLNLEGSNTVAGGNRRAGVEKTNVGSLTIGSESGTGKLEATGGFLGAGVGGGSSGDVDNIKITGGSITAVGGDCAAGIGGGYGGVASNITISGDAQVKAAGGEKFTGRMEHGAAIGEGTLENGAGTEIIPDTSGLYTTGKIEYYHPGADLEKDTPYQTITGTVEPPKKEEPAASNPSAPMAKPVSGVLYRVTTLDGKDIPYGAQRAEGTLTVTANREDAILTGSLSGLKTLKEQNVTAITFVTGSGSATFGLDDLLAQGELSQHYALTVSGRTVTFTLEGTDISGMLK